MNARKLILWSFACKHFFLRSYEVVDADDAHQQWSECSVSTYLLQYWSDVFQRQRRKLVLLQEIVQILFQHFKHQTCVVLVLKALKCSNKVELVGILLAEARQDRNFNLSLSGVGWMVLKNFYGDNITGAFLPALHYLSKGSPTEKFKNLKQTCKQQI